MVCNQTTIALYLLLLIQNMDEGHDESKTIQIPLYYLIGPESCVTDLYLWEKIGNEILDYLWIRASNCEWIDGS